MHSVITVTINRLDSQERSNIMVCTCDMPSNYLLPCSHVMAVNQHVFHHPVIMAQVGDRWRRDWQPSSFQPRQQATQPSEPEDKNSMDGEAQQIQFAHPEDEEEGKTIAWEMGCDDVMARVNEALQLSRDRPAMMDIADRMREQ
jgi:hypothetical protein